MKRGADKERLQREKTTIFFKDMLKREAGKEGGGIQGRQVEDMRRESEHDPKKFRAQEWPNSTKFHKIILKKHEEKYRDETGKERSARKSYPCREAS